MNNSLFFWSIAAGLIDFLYEAKDLANGEKHLENDLKNGDKHFENRFIYLSKRLWELGIHPNDF